MNARAMTLLGGPGSGKTKSLAELARTEEDVGVCAVDPIGQLGKELERDARVDVIHVPDKASWISARVNQTPLWEWVVGRLRDRGRVVLVCKTSYGAAVDVADHLIPLLERGNVQDLLIIFDEVQRVLAQNKEYFSYAALNAMETGRNNRWGRVAATQRYADVDKRAVERNDTLLLGRITGKNDADAVRGLLAMNVHDRGELDVIIQEMLHLPAGRFILREPDTPPGVNT
jgi:hypothetical protein